MPLAYPGTTRPMADVPNEAREEQIAETVLALF
jgi:hypothetical protein